MYLVQSFVSRGVSFDAQNGSPDICEPLLVEGKAALGRARVVLLSPSEELRRLRRHVATLRHAVPEALSFALA